MIKYLSIILFLLISNTSIAQLQKEDISSFQFTSIFGSKKGQVNDVYCLLGIGYFKAKRADNIDNFIKDWITKHPKAKIIPVCSSGPIVDTNLDSRIIYCWAIENQEILNVDMVRYGIVAGGTMIRPRAINTKDEKEAIKIEIGNKDYESFIEKVKDAELKAKKEKLGIWASDKK